MKRFLPLLMLTGLLFGQENGLSQQEFTKMCSVMISSGELPEGFDIEFRFQIHDNNKDGYVDAEELSEMMKIFLGKHDSGMIIEIATADAKEDFNTKLIWSGASIAAFAGGFYVGDDNLLDQGWLMGGAVALIGPPAASYLIPVNIPRHRFYELSTKSEEYQIVYRTAYNSVTRNQRLKYSLLGTGGSIVALGVYAALGLIWLNAIRI